MPDLKYYIKRCFFLICCASLQIVLAVMYYGRKRIVLPVRNPLLLKSATTLAKEIRERKIKCEDVIQAYIDRILEVEPIINAVAQDNFDGALKEAKEVDLLIESETFSNEELFKEKPLLGVPFTAKCCFSVKGFPQTAGSLLFADIIATEDAPCVALLKKAGGIFLALTNAPELTCSIETSNYIYGRTFNPYDSTKTPGGSSGGEAALIASAGSVIGIGTDMFGSNRIPASFCCIFGYKPTRGWTSNKGLRPKHQPSVDGYVTTGPLCRYSEDLPTLLNVLSINKKTIDLAPQVDFKKVKIYYQTDMKYVWGVSTDEEVAQCVRNAAFYFKQAYGVEVNEINVPLFSKSNAVVSHALRKGLTKADLLSMFSDGRLDGMSETKEFLKFIFGKSQFTPYILYLFFMCFSPMVSNEKDIPLYEEIHKELEQEFDKFLDKDAVFICPTTPTTAFYHGQHYTHIYNCYWTGIFNLTGCPSAHCPMGLSNKKLPVGIQIASCKGNDALIIACVNELEKVFGGWIPPQ